MESSRAARPLEWSSRLPSPRSPSTCTASSRGSLAQITADLVSVWQNSSASHRTQAAQPSWTTSFFFAPL